jgi:hypothetical protein
MFFSKILSLIVFDIFICASTSFNSSYLSLMKMKDSRYGLLNVQEKDAMKKNNVNSFSFRRFTSFQPIAYILKKKGVCWSEVLCLL